MVYVMVAGAVFGAVAVVELLCALMGSAILNPIYTENPA